MDLFFTRHGIQFLWLILLLSLQSIQFAGSSADEIHVRKRSCDSCDPWSKWGFAAVSMAWYSGKKYPGRSSMAVSLGCMYGLSNFMLGYYSNVMWFDCIMIASGAGIFIEQVVINTGKEWKDELPWCWGTGIL